MSIDLAPVAAELTRLGHQGSHPAGAVVGVLVEGVLSVAASGVAVAGEGPGDASAAMQPETVVDLASVTKVASTTALAMRLVARGELDLDAPVREVLPVFGAGPRSAVRVRHLLEHTSGLPAWLPLYCRTTDRQEAIAFAARQPLECEPGSRWVYSDLGMMVLGAVLEQVSGQRQDHVFAHLVAGPLGLAATAYGPRDPRGTAAGADSDVVEHEMVRRGEPYAVPFTAEDFHGWRDEPLVGVASDGNAAHALGGVAGHAGLFAPVPELLRLGAWLTDPAVHHDVVGRFAEPLDVAPDRGLGFRLATARVGDEQVPMVAHPGFTGTYLASALDRELVVAVAATRLHTTTGGLRSPRTPREGLVGVDDIARTAMAGVADALVRDGVLPGAGRDVTPARTTRRTAP